MTSLPPLKSRSETLPPPSLLRVKAGAFAPAISSRPMWPMCLPFVVVERSMSHMPFASEGRNRFHTHGGRSGRLPARFCFMCAASDKGCDYRMLSDGHQRGHRVHQAVSVGRVPYRHRVMHRLARRPWFGLRYTVSNLFRRPLVRRLLLGAAICISLA